jgi:hypothetical protein
MAKRKPTEIVQLRLRLPEKLRKKIEVEARKSDWSLNREMVRRLEQSFVQQGTEALIQSAAQAVAVEVFKQQLGLVEDLAGEFNRINQALGRPEMAIHLKQGEHGDG